MQSLLCLLLLVGIVTSAPALLSDYDPVHVKCPNTPLVRQADGISDPECAYVDSRRPCASTALKEWLVKINPAFKTEKLPTVALTTSGGGLRSLLTGAGFIQALDERDSNVGTSGLFQGLTYQAGLSGGAWLLSSFAGNNYPTISSLKDQLWKAAFDDNLLIPDGDLAAVAYLAIANDLVAKQAAMFSPTLVDAWGRILSYEFLYGTDGGVATTMSSLTHLSNFTSHSVPYPIITAIGVDPSKGCAPTLDAPIYEFHPYEFGSFDLGISSFIPTQYIGTSLNNGAPKDNECVSNYDNLGYILGTSSDLFFELCPVSPSSTTSSSPSTASAFSAAASALTSLLSAAHQPNLPADLFAAYPNPFYNSPSSPLVSAQPSLTLVDGGASGQNNPIFPFLEPSRNVDAIIVNDNSADTDDNFPNGIEIYKTYLRAQAAGLDRMPNIPDNTTFVAQGLNKRPTFFGCDKSDKVTIVYMPNVAYSFNSGQETLKLTYTQQETDAMVSNGNLVATNGGNDVGWATCLGCALVQSLGDEELPEECDACFDKYCYRKA